MSMRATSRVVLAAAATVLAGTRGSVNGLFASAAAEEAVDVTKSGAVEESLNYEGSFQRPAEQSSNDTISSEVGLRSAKKGHYKRFPGADHDVHILPVRWVPFKLQGDEDVCLAIAHQGEAKFLPGDAGRKEVYAANCSDDVTQLWSYHGSDKTLRPKVNPLWCLVRENNKHNNGTLLHVAECKKAGKAGDWFHTGHFDFDYDHDHAHDHDDGALFDLSTDLCIGVAGDANDGAPVVLTPSATTPEEGRCFEPSADPEAPSDLPPGKEGKLQQQQHVQKVAGGALRGSR